MALEDRMNLTRSNQTVQYQGSAVNQQSQPYSNYAISGDNDRTSGFRGDQKGQRIISISDDMIIISANQLEALIEEKVKLRIKQHEDQLRSSQQLEARVKSLEESVMQLNRSTMVFQTQNAVLPNNNVMTNSISLTDRLERVQQQLGQLGKK